MPEETKTTDSKTSGTGTQSGQSTGAAAGTGTAQTFSQDDVNRIAAEERRKTEERFKDSAEKARLWDAYESDRKKKEDAEKPELERLRSQVSDLTPFKTRAEEQDAAIKAVVDAKIAAIPAEKKTLVPEGLSNWRLFQWLEANATLLFGTTAAAAPGVGAPAGGKPPEGTADPLRSEAEAKMKIMYPLLKPGTEPYKAKAEQVYQSIKAQKEGKGSGNPYGVQFPGSASPQQQ